VPFAKESLSYLRKDAIIASYIFLVPAKINKQRNVDHKALKEYPWLDKFFLANKKVRIFLLLFPSAQAFQLFPVSSRFLPE
jgi:hypothetical protein